MSDDSTVHSRPEQDYRDIIRTGFELLVTRDDGTSSRFPIWYGNVVVGGPEVENPDLRLSSDSIGAWQGTFHFREGALFFTNMESALPVLLNGEPATFSPVRDEDKITLPGYEIKILHLAAKLALIEGCSEPHKGDMWGIGSEPVKIGRGSKKRANDVEVKDVTVSRAHATIKFERDKFELHLDTLNSPTRVNGKLIEKTTQLDNGALLQLGQQLLRFRINKVEKKRRDLVPQEATILFSDVWNYSTFAEGRPLEETINQMNEFYAGLGKVIKERGGVLLTFLGDAMMAVFGSEGPDEKDPERAVYAALAMQERLKELNKDWLASGRPSLQVGVGINSGEVMVGDVGFTGKLEFAAMGDNTNLAARVEKLTRELGHNIIITGSTRESLGETFELVELGTTKVKGRQKSVEIFGVAGVKEEFDWL